MMASIVATTPDQVRKCASRLDEIESVQALELGLIDGLGNASYVAREVIGEAELVDFTVKDSPLERFTKQLGVSIGSQLALWMGFQGPQLR